MVDFPSVQKTTGQYVHLTVVTTRAWLQLHVTCFCTWWSLLPGWIFSRRRADEQQWYTLRRFFPLSIQVLHHPATDCSRRYNTAEGDALCPECMFLNEDLQQDYIPTVCSKFFTMHVSVILALSTWMHLISPHSKNAPILYIHFMIFMSCLSGHTHTKTDLTNQMLVCLRETRVYLWPDLKYELWQATHATHGATYSSSKLFSEKIQ